MGRFGLEVMTSSSQGEEGGSIPPSDTFIVKFCKFAYKDFVYCLFKYPRRKINLFGMKINKRPAELKVKEIIGLFQQFYGSFQHKCEKCKKN